MSEYDVHVQKVDLAKTRIQSFLESATAPVPSQDLIAHLVDETDLLEDDVRTALWALISEKAIEVTRERRLVLKASVSTSGQILRT